MKRVTAMLLSLFLVVSLTGIPALAGENEVVGYSSARVEPVDLTGVPDLLTWTAEAPAASYQITNAAGLVKLAQLVNEGSATFAGVTVYLASDINMELVSAYAPIGLDDTNAYFAGTFDGQGHVIENLKATTAVQNSGLFGAVKDATIRNLVIGEHSSFLSKFTAEDRVGAVVGLTQGNVVIDNVYNMASVQGMMLIGGIVGRINSGAPSKTVIRNCTNTGSVQGMRRIGGIVGISGNVEIVNCRNTGTVRCLDSSNGGGAWNAQHSAGGILGEIWGNTAVITGCVNNGEVTAKGSAAGGIAGSAYSASLGVKMSGCINYGAFSVETDNESARTGVFLAYSEKNNDEIAADNQDRTSQSDPTLSGALETIVPEFGFEETEDPTADPDAPQPEDPYDDGVTDETGVVGYSSERVKQADLTEVPDILTWTAESTENAYKITKAEGLVKLSEIVNGGNDLAGITVYLANNISMNEVAEYIPIGYDVQKPFRGTFEGQGNIIDYLGIYAGESIVTAANNTRFGLFGYIENATVRDLVIGENCAFFNSTRKGVQSVGAVAGEASGQVLIENIFSMCDLSAIQHTGGIVGRVLGSDVNDRVIIRNCTNAGPVAGEYQTGGIVGLNESVGVLIIKNCRNIGDVECISAQQAGNAYRMTVGGIVGSTHGGTMSLVGCINNGNLISKNTVGGLLGQIYQMPEVRLTDCIVYGSVSSDKALSSGEVYGTKADAAIFEEVHATEVRLGEEDETLSTVEDFENVDFPNDPDPTGEENLDPDLDPDPDPDPDESDAQNTDTAAPDSSDTDAPKEADDATAPAGDDAEEGCASVMGGAVMVVLAAAAACGVVCRKKKD